VEDGALEYRVKHVRLFLGTRGVLDEEGGMETRRYSFSLVNPVEVISPVPLRPGNHPPRRSSSLRNRRPAGFPTGWTPS
jgi:hypothetical protein